MPRYEALRLLAAFHASGSGDELPCVRVRIFRSWSTDFRTKVGWAYLIAAFLALLSMAALSWRWVLPFRSSDFQHLGHTGPSERVLHGVTKSEVPASWGWHLQTGSLCALLLVSHVLVSMVLASGKTRQRKTCDAAARS